MVKSYFVSDNYYLKMGAFSRFIGISPLYVDRAVSRIRAKKDANLSEEEQQKRFDRVHAAYGRLRSNWILGECSDEDKELLSTFFIMGYICTEQDEGITLIMLAQELLQKTVPSIYEVMELSDFIKEVCFERISCESLI